MPADFIDIVSAHARTAPERRAIVMVRHNGRGVSEEALTYGELDEAARTIAVRLAEYCSPGDRVLLLYPTGLHFAVALLGCMYAGVVPAPAPLPEGTRHHLSRTTGIALDTEAKAVLTDADNLPGVTAWLERDGLTAVSGIAADTLWADPAELNAWRRPEPGDLAFLQYTSGSTSDPKGVMVSHVALLANLTLIRDQMGFDARTRFSSWLPMYHDMGLIGLLLEPLFLSSTTYVMSPMDFLKRPQLWLQTIHRHGVHVSSAPNFAYDLCTRRLSDEQIAELDLSGWTHACNGAEPVNAQTLARFTERFAATGFRAEALLPCYGMAETTLFVAGTPADRAPVITHVNAGRLEKHVFEPDADGVPLVSSGLVEGYDLHVVDPESHEVLADGYVGEIWVRGSSVARGYWNNEDATRRIFQARTSDGETNFLRTGDLGVLYEGQLYITGRIKEMLILNGRNVYPHDVEREVATGHEAFGGLAGSVFTVPTPDERIVVVQEVRARSESDLSALTALASRIVAEHLKSSVSNVVLVRPGKVRKTTSGKIQRSLMRNLFMNGELEVLHEELDRQVRGRYRVREVA
ncbi:fatty acyl-AMP ligase [Streptomyces sp. UNOC14_S4]|uniref:fatty acyl-AMP ligase n=1 Tax=Streptomyces sp. UNOC14_S4 TaxID=2872340 RepID=UPI001E4FA3A5|nr:fatty acyl-AMP ligase [Streptomyces sp. UNOC14_S4]MCC3767173.1 fatty acyl-AMP ligase [Streptomyces sp. UNOC14_S4]